MGAYKTWGMYHRSGRNGSGLLQAGFLRIKQHNILEEQIIIIKLGMGFNIRMGSWKGNLHLLHNVKRLKNKNEKVQQITIGNFSHQSTCQGLLCTRHYKQTNPGPAWVNHY